MMPNEKKHNPKFDAPLSENKKKELGIDDASFMKRMLSRLQKVRGEDVGTDTFLLRHNYKVFNDGLA